MVKHTATSVVTIERFIIEQERHHPEATGELSGILYDIALAAKMIANKVRRAGLVDILGATERRERPGRGAAEARRLRQRDDHQGARPQRPGLRDGVGGRAGHHPDSRRLPVRQVLPALRSARRLVQHRRQRAGRHHLLRRAARSRAVGTARWRTCSSRACAGRRGLRDVRLEHDAGVHHRAGRARLHARSDDRRVPALASEHPHSRRAGSTIA